MTDVVEPRLFGRATFFFALFYWSIFWMLSNSYFGIFFAIKGFTNIYLIVGLFVGLTCNKESTKFFRSFEYGPVIGGKEPFKIFRANKGSEFASNGSFRAHKW